jgi:GT2 family glycosyltransferase
LQEKVCTVLLNWNGWQDTAVCLSSLRHLRYENNTVIVVDNGSTNDSASRLRSQFPWAELIETGKNLGFAGGCNVGIRHALKLGAEFVWLLNNDTRVDPDALRHLVEKTRIDRMIAAVGSAIYCLAEPDRLQAWGGGHVNFLLGRSRHFLRPVPDKEIDYITGASLLLRSSALESVGLLDEGFFFSWEDADLGFRLRRAHWKLAVAGKSKIWHKETSSLRGNNTTLDTYFNRAAMRFFKKHSPVPQIPLYVGLGLRVSKRLLVGDWKRVQAVWRGYQPAQPSSKPFETQ